MLFYLNCIYWIDLFRKTKGIAKGSKTKPIIVQKILLEPLLAAIKYKKPAKQKEIINRTKHPIAKPFHIREQSDYSCLQLFMA